MLIVNLQRRSGNRSAIKAVGAAFLVLLVIIFLAPLPNSAMGADFGTLLDPTSSETPGSPESCEFKRSANNRGVQHSNATCINTIGQKEWVFREATKNGLQPFDQIRYSQAASELQDRDYSWFPFAKSHNSTSATLANVNVKTCAQVCNDNELCIGFNYFRESRQCNWVHDGVIDGDGLDYEVPGAPSDYFQKKIATARKSNAQSFICLNTLVGPNRFAGNQRLDLGGVTTRQTLDLLCDGDKDIAAPALCYQFVMAGNVAWDRNGSNQWAELNAARLCAKTEVYNLTTTCFETLIQVGKPFPEALETCRVK